VYTFQLIIKVIRLCVRTEKIKFIVVIINIRVEISIMLHELIISYVKL